MLYAARADPGGLIAPSGAIPSIAADVRNPLMVVHAITTQGIILTRNSGHVVLKVGKLQMKVHITVTGAGKNHNYRHDGYFDDKESRYSSL